MQQRPQQIKACYMDSTSWSSEHRMCAVAFGCSMCLRQGSNCGLTVQQNIVGKRRWPMKLKKDNRMSTITLKTFQVHNLLFNLLLGNTRFRVNAICLFSHA